MGPRREIFAFHRTGNPCAPASPGARFPRSGLSPEPTEDATNATGQASFEAERTTKAAMTMLGAAGLGFSLAGNASASTVPAADIPPSDNASPNQRFVLGEEEMADVSLATFYLFDKENVGGGVQMARGCGGCGRGCGGCRGCGHGCGGCRGCGSRAPLWGLLARWWLWVRIGILGCVACAGCAGCAGCCLTWGACRLC